MLLATLIATLLSIGFPTNAAAAATQHATQSQQQLKQTAQSQIVFKPNDAEKTSEYWLKAGKLAIDKALRNTQNTRRAKNAILFIGDGMSLTTITAARIFQGQLLNKSGEEDQLSFEVLPNVALIKTYNLDQQIPDSAATATAILSGVKANFLHNWRQRKCKAK